MDSNEALAEIFNIAEVLLDSEDVAAIHAYPGVLSIHTTTAMHTFYRNGEHQVDVL